MTGRRFFTGMLLGASTFGCGLSQPDGGGAAQSTWPGTSTAQVPGRIEHSIVDSLRTIEANDTYNAFITVNADAITDARLADRTPPSSRGPLYGLSVAVKENIEVAGLRNTVGTPALDDYVPADDADVVRRLKAAGAIVVGKANMHELAYGITSNNYAYGPVRNANNPNYFAGGSSGGTAVAVALGMADIGLGSDTGGSARIPAALNGIVGLRPTVGRYSVDGLIRISSTRDTVGVLAGSVALVRLTDSVLSGDGDDTDVDLRQLRIGVPRSYFYDDLEPAVAQCSNNLVESLKQAGATIVEADIPDIGRLSQQVGFPVVLYETRQLLEALVDEHLQDQTLDSFVDLIASPDVRRIFDSVTSGAISPAAYREALYVHRPKLQEAYRNYFRQHALDAAMFPTTPLTAREIEDSTEDVIHNGRRVPTFSTYIRNTDPGSNAGIPGLSIPLGVSANGMPFGIELDGPEGSDTALLAIGEALESFVRRHPCMTGP